MEGVFMNVVKKERLSLRQQIIRYVVLTVSAFVYGVAVSLFLDPNSLAPGGVTGIAIIFNRIIKLETGTLMLLINLPILILGTWKFGLRFIVSTIYCTFLTSLFTNLLEPIGALTEDPLLAAITGGSLVAIALGCVFKAGATTGGTDVIIKVLRLKFPHLRTGALFLVTDALIVIASAFVFRDVNKALYAGLTVVVTSMVMDVVLYGRDGAKLIYIISDHSEKIATRILEELDIGVTYMQGKGAYSGTDKQVILCAVKKQIAPKTEAIVREEDALAFMIVTSATEIYGEGYKSYFSEKI